VNASGYDYISNDIFVPCVYFHFIFLFIVIAKLKNVRVQTPFDHNSLDIAWFLTTLPVLRFFIARALGNRCCLAKDVSFIILFLKISAKLIYPKKKICIFLDRLLILFWATLIPAYRKICLMLSRNITEYYSSTFRLIWIVHLYWFITLCHLLIPNRR